MKTNGEPPFYSHQKPMFSRALSEPVSAWVSSLNSQLCAYNHGPDSTPTPSSLPMRRPCRDFGLQSRPIACCNPLKTRLPEIGSNRNTPRIEVYENKGQSTVLTATRIPTFEEKAKVRTAALAEGRRSCIEWRIGGVAAQQAPPCLMDKPQ